MYGSLRPFLPAGWSSTVVHAVKFMNGENTQQEEETGSSQTPTLTSECCPAPRNGCGIALCYDDRNHTGDPLDYYGMGTTKRCKRQGNSLLPFQIPSLPCFREAVQELSLGLPLWFRHTNWDVVDDTIRDHTLLGRGPLEVNGQSYDIRIRSHGCSLTSDTDIIVIMVDIRKPRRSLKQLCEAHKYIASGKPRPGTILAVAVYRQFWTTLWHGEELAAKNVAANVGALLLTHSLLSAAPPASFLHTMVASHLTAEVIAGEWLQHWRDSHTTRLGAHLRIILWDLPQLSAPAYMLYRNKAGDWGVWTQDAVDEAAVEKQLLPKDNGCRNSHCPPKSNSRQRKLQRRRERALDKLAGKRAAAARTVAKKKRRSLRCVDSDTESES
ncbi:hypothetical protein C8R43DRAFT_941784 [Mycena crocata]|nr:hypothetical protein C8R43DRAFT_941784 [Mycena crocata]